MFAIPYIFIMIVIVLNGQIADRIRARKILSTTAVRKIQTIIGNTRLSFSSLVETLIHCILMKIGGVGSSLFLVLIGYVGCSKIGAMLCITLAVSFIGFHSSGCQISHLDIASNYAGFYS